MKDTIILLSGGLDSLVLLHAEKERVGAALFVDYGQAAEREERAAAISILGLP